MYTHRISIDVTPGAEPPVIHVSQYDAGSRTISFDLYSSDGELTIPSGATVSINGTKPDGNGFDYEATLEDNTVTMTLTEQMAAIAGKVPCKIVIEKNAQKLLTEKFILMVDRAALDRDTLSSDSEVRQLVEIMDNSAEIIQAARDAEAAQTAAENAQTAAEDARDAAVRAKNTVESDAGDISTTIANGLAAIGQARTLAEGSIDDKAETVARMRVNAEAVAAAALQKANNLENEFTEVASTNEQLRAAIQNMQLLLNTKVDNGYADAQGYLILTSNGEDVSDRIGPFAGGGGGGGGGGSETVDAVFTASNITGWITRTISGTDTCNVSIEWSSIENEMATGNGALRITVNGIVKTSLEVAQGIVTVDIASYLSTGSNTVSLRISDTYGQAKTYNMSVTVVVLSLSSTFDTGVQYDSVIQFPYTPIGAVTKTVHFVVDGIEIGTAVTSVSGNQMTYTIPAQDHGSHSIRCYFEATINSQTVRSNELYFEFMSVDPLNTASIISSSYSTTSVAQYATITVPYSVYNPLSLTAEVNIYVNNQLASTRTVDRTEQTFTYRPQTAGSLVIKFVSGSTEKSLPAITVTETSINVNAEPNNLELFFSSQGRSNQEANPWTWASDAGSSTVNAVMTGFDGTANGWQEDEDGITCLRVSGGASVLIPFYAFASDIRLTGLTIEIEYATRNVADYSTTILSCMSGNKGITITPQTATLRSEQTELSMQYKENEHIRIAYTVDKRAEDRLVKAYIDGKIARGTQYPADDDFSQVTPAGITIGSQYCTIDVYCIRIYTNNLNSRQIINNWIADTQDGGEMLDRYTRNQVYDEYGKVVIAQLPSNLPYMIIEAEELSQYKGDKKTVSITYTDPLHPAKSFTAVGVQLNVQGTSSAPYYRKNYDLQFKSGFNMLTSGHSDTYRLRDNSIPTARFVIKADVASSESANNTQLVRLYNDICPYKTPEMEEDSRVRWGIDGFPIVVFWHDTVTDTTKFLAKYNFNFPKRFPEGMGYAV